ncbi:MAG: hypothetical protein U0270_24795 [Labilithrix sp.]
MRLIAAVSTSTLLVLAGCSSDDTATNNPGASSGTSGSTNAEGGSPIPGTPGDHSYWTKSTNIAHYKVFPDRAAAITWFQGVQDRGDTGLENDTPVPGTDGRYAGVDEKVAEVYKGFQDQYPADTQDLPVPIVVLVESPRPGAYAVYDPELGLSPNVFMIQTPTLKLGDDALRGVIAHELTHHVFKHKWPEVAQKIEKWYDAAKTTGDGFGFEQSNDTAVAKVGRTAQVYGQSTGDYPLTQWNGATRPGGTLDDFVGYLHVKAKATNAAACADSDAAYIALVNYADPLRDRATSTLAPTPEQLAQIDTLSKAYITKETACTSVVTMKFFALVGEALEISEAARARAGLAGRDRRERQRHERLRRARAHREEVRRVHDDDGPEERPLLLVRGAGRRRVDRHPQVLEAHVERHHDVPLPGRPRRDGSREVQQLPGERAALRRAQRPAPLRLLAHLAHEEARQGRDRVSGAHVLRK